MPESIQPPATYTELIALYKEHYLARVLCEPAEKSLTWPDLGAVRERLLDPTRASMALTHQGDWWPDPRTPSIHPFGVVALGQFSPERRLDDLGLFGQDCTVVLRYSIATQVGADHSGDQWPLSPGIAIKWLVDGLPSRNLQLVVAVEGIDDLDFLGHTFTTYPAEPNFDRYPHLEFLLRRFQTARALAGGTDLGRERQIPIGPMTAVRRDGTTVPNPQQLDAVTLEHSSEAKRTFPRMSRWDEFREHLATCSRTLHRQTPFVSLLGLKQGQRFKLGDIWLHEPLHTSRFGDQQLFFSHAVV